MLTLDFEIMDTVNRLCHICQNVEAGARVRFETLFAFPCGILSSP